MTSLPPLLVDPDGDTPFLPQRSIFLISSFPRIAWEVFVIGLSIGGATFPLSDIFVRNLEWRSGMALERTTIPHVEQ